MGRSLIKVLLFIPAILPVIFYAGSIKGVIKDTKGNPIPYASIYVKNTTLGTISNLKGEFSIQLSKGEPLLVFSFVGYKTLEKRFIISSSTEVIYDEIILEEDNASLNELQVFSDNRDRAKEIMSEVRKKRSEYFQLVENYTCSTYNKLVLQKKVKLKEDSIYVDSVEIELEKESLNSYFEKQNLSLIETHSKTTYIKPRKYQEHILAQQDYSETKGKISNSISFGIEIGEEDLAPEPVQTTNPNIIYKDLITCDFNFYKNTINYPELTMKPLLSPLAETGALNYKYDLLGSFYEEGKLIYKIKVEPLFVTDAVFRGVIYVEDSTYKVKLLDLSVNKKALLLCDDFRIIQKYNTRDSFVVPEKREINYTLKNGNDYILANIRMHHELYDVNKTPTPKIGNEVRSFAIDALDKEEDYWKENRTISLSIKEKKFIQKCDSLKEYFSSAEYINSADSSYNKFTIWSPIIGYGRRNSYKRQSWMIQGLLGQVQPFGIGGYRHKLPGSFNKEFENNNLLELDGFVDYGFRNKDVKGKIKAGLTYFPKKFVRTTVVVGDYYDMINDFASISQTFSRSNYVREVMAGFKQRVEIINGLFLEAGFIYSDQRPINNLVLSGWSNELFGQLNIPVNFERYIKSEFSLELKYRVNQKYMIKNNKKIIFATKHPILFAKYRKGVPDLFNSEVNYDYIEVGASQKLKLKRLGTSSWQAVYANFFNSANLRVLEYKYFRGSDRFFFSNPARSFQLLGSTFSTPNDYVQINYIHHFEGSILGKIPLLNRSKIELAAGGGMLYVEDNNFRHVEVFVGIERPIVLWRQLFKLGIYAVTADDSLNEADFSLKVGINFFNVFNGRWDY